MITHIFNRQKELKIGKSSPRALLRSVLSFLQLVPEEVALYFVTEERIAELHAQFFDDPTPTDCISFPLDQSHLGEIFVCPKAALRYSAKRNLDPYREASLYVVHGLLHLIGYDDQTEKKRRSMRKKEKSCMDHLYKQKSLLSPE